MGYHSSQGPSGCLVKYSVGDREGFDAAPFTCLWRYLGTYLRALGTHNWAARPEADQPVSLLRLRWMAPTLPACHPGAALGRYYGSYGILALEARLRLSGRRECFFPCISMCALYRPWVPKQARQARSTESSQTGMQVREQSAQALKLEFGSVIQTVPTVLHST